MIISAAELPNGGVWVILALEKQVVYQLAEGSGFIFPFHELRPGSVAALTISNLENEDDRSVAEALLAQASRIDPRAEKLIRINLDLNVLEDEPGTFVTHPLESRTGKPDSFTVIVGEGQDSLRYWTDCFCRDNNVTAKECGSVSARDEFEPANFSDETLEGITLPLYDFRETRLDGKVHRG